MNLRGTWRLIGALLLADPLVGCRQPEQKDAPPPAPPGGTQAKTAWRPAPGTSIGDTAVNPKDGAVLVWVAGGRVHHGLDYWWGR